MISCIATALVGLGALWSLLKYFCPWLPHDIRFFVHIFKSVKALRRFAKKTPMYTVTSRLIDRAAQLPDKTYVVTEQDCFTYKQVNDRASQVARALRKIGLKAEEPIGLLMTNCVEWVHVWFGINKAGGISSLINHNLRGDSLLHCIKISECRTLIISDDVHIHEALGGIRRRLDDMKITVYVTAHRPRAETLRYRPLLDMADSESSEETPKDWVNHVTMLSHMCYIFTSGTTGLPKQAIITHHRGWMGAKIPILVGVASQDVVYTTLPLYHGSAMIFGMLGVLETGSTMVLRKKFSASAFWDDCRKYKVTVVQYIGEISRYLCNQPERPDDKHHDVRIALGNGITPEVWRRFLDRFGRDITVSEFYTSTEGNIGYYNVDGIFGRLGLSSPLYNLLCGISLVKCDIETGEAIRDEDGRCIKCALGEPGLIIGRRGKHTPFFGYRGDKELSRKKLLTNVFKPGDQYFNSGDIVLRHRDYTVSFVDRVGDTYRWKGENVSTYEVSDVMAKGPDVAEANVYGVKIPGYEGRAGMAVLVLAASPKSLDCEKVYEHARNSLPHYARPVFIRVQSELELTGTMKQRKSRLVEDGYDLNRTGGDSVFVIDMKKNCYIPLTKNVAEAINNKTFLL